VHEYAKVSRAILESTYPQLSKIALFNRAFARIIFHYGGPHTNLNCSGGGVKKINPKRGTVYLCVASSIGGSTKSRCGTHLRPLFVVEGNAQRPQPVTPTAGAHLGRLRVSAIGTLPATMHLSPGSGSSVLRWASRSGECFDCGAGPGAIY
jgi:hypothetical protein